MMIFVKNWISESKTPRVSNFHEKMGFFEVKRGIEFKSIVLLEATLGVYFSFKKN